MVDGKGDYKQYKIRSENVFDIISIGSIIALFSNHQSFQLFYLCNILDFQSCIGAVTRLFQPCYWCRIKVHNVSVFRKVFCNIQLAYKCCTCFTSISCLSTCQFRHIFMIINIWLTVAFILRWFQIDSFQLLFKVFMKTRNWF